jgi:hypothetical protein
VAAALAEPSALDAATLMAENEELKRQLQARNTQIRNLRAQLHILGGSLDQARQGQYIPPELRRQILACLHPDRVDGSRKREYERAFQGFSEHFRDDRRRK